MAHHHETSYPESFPTACVTSAISIFRGGRDSIIAEKKTLGLDIYNVQGYAQRFLIGAPDEPSANFGAGDEAAATEQMRELCTSASGALGVYGSEDFGARDWRALLKWFMENIAPLLIPLILENQT